MRRTVLAFALLGLLALVVVSVAGVVVINRIAEDQALDDAERLAEVDANIVQRRLRDGLLTGDAEATLAVAGVVFDAVLLHPVVGVSIRTRDGLTLYADVPEAIGSIVELDDAEDRIVAEGGSDTQEVGDTLEVSRRIRTPDGIPLLFQMSIRLAAVEAAEREVLDTFAPRLVFALVVFSLVAGLLALSVARRVTDAARERAMLLQRAMDAQDRERRRIAGDLHDGPVQELAGLAMSLSARAETVPEGPWQETLRAAATAVRASVRTLRSAIVGVYPPNLQQAGLGAAISDLTARLTQEGLQVTVDVSEPSGYGPSVDELLYRVCMEALRNVEVHAGASHVWVRVGGQAGHAALEVRDDGSGTDEEAVRRAQGDGHVGLRIIGDLVRDAGGTMSITRVLEGGTVLRVEVPVP